MQESRRNEVSADEWSESKVVGKTNVGTKQKSSERQMWVENKSGAWRLSEKSNIRQ